MAPTRQRELDHAYHTYNTYHTYHTYHTDHADHTDQAHDTFEELHPRRSTQKTEPDEKRHGLYVGIYRKIVKKTHVW